MIKYTSDLLCVPAAMNLSKQTGEFLSRVFIGIETGKSGWSSPFFRRCAGSVDVRRVFTLPKFAGRVENWLASD
jgi:hypothetical protein